MAARRLLDRVEREVERGVADGVERERPARRRRLEDAPAHRVGVVLQVAVIAGAALVLVAHLRRAAEDRAVGEDLHGPELQPLVAPARAHAGAEAAPHGLVVVARDRGERIHHRHHLHAGAEAAGVARSLVGGELRGRVPDPARRDPRIRHAREPLAGVLRGRELERPLDRGERVGEQDRLHERHGALLEHARRASVVAQHDEPALHRLTGARVDAREPDRGARRLPRVAGCVLDPHGTAPARAVQGVAVGHGAVEQHGVVAGGDHPFARAVLCACASTAR